MAANKFIMIFTLLLFVFSFNTNAYEISDSRTLFYNHEVNLNFLDLTKTQDYSKVILSVINFDNNEIYFEKDLNLSGDNLNNFTFSKLYASKLLFNYDFYDLNTQLLFQKTYQVNLINSPKDFQIFICNSEKKENCIHSSKFNYKDPIYLFSSNPSLTDYNVSIFNSIGGLYKSYNSVSFPLKLNFDYLGVYKIKVETNNVSKTQVIEITTQKQNSDYFQDISNISDVGSSETITNIKSSKNKVSNLSLFLKISLIIIIIIFIYLLLFIVRPRNKTNRRRDRKKIMVLILFILFLFSNPIYSSEIEYNNLETSYFDLQTKFEYPKEVSLIVYPNTLNQNKIIPIVDFDEVYSEGFNLNDSYAIDDLSNFSTDLNFELLDVYLIVNKDTQETLKLNNFKTYQECYNIINFYNNNAIESKTDLFNRTFSGLVNTNKFSESCILELVDSGFLVPKKLLVKINYSDTSFDYNKSSSFNLQFNISHIFWNSDSKKIKLNFIYSGKLDLQMYPSNNNVIQFFDLKNNDVNISSKKYFPKATNDFNLSVDDLSLQGLTFSNDFNYFEFKLINNDVIKFNNSNLTSINIENTISNYNLKSISTLSITDDPNKFIIDYYLIDGNLPKSNPNVFSRSKSKLKIKSERNNITFYNNNGLFVKNDFGYKKITKDNYNSNKYYYYEVYPDYIDFYIIDYGLENITIYNEVFSYTFFNYLFKVNSDFNITNINSNNFGRNITIDNNYNFNSDMFFSNLGTYFLIDNDQVLKEEGNLNNFYNQDQNADFEQILNNQHNFFKDDFNELKRKIIISTDISNAYNLSKSQTDYFIAYYLSKIEDSFNSALKVHDLFCKSDGYDKYNDYFKNVKLSYFKYNFIESTDVYGNNPFNIESNFSKKDYDRLCGYLVEKPNLETTDFTIAIFLGAEFLRQEKLKDSYLDSVIVNGNSNLVFTEKELYLFVSNYLLINNILNNEDFTYAYEINKIYNNSFLDFKIPNYNYDEQKIEEVVSSNFLDHPKYVGNCAKLSVDSLNYLFNYDIKFNVADAWYLVGNNNVSVWTKDLDDPLNLAHLIPGVILGIHTSGNNYYEYENFVKPGNYDLPSYYLNKGFYSYSGNKIKVPYTHVVSYLGDIGNDRGVILNAGSSNSQSLLLSDYVPRGKEEGSWINRTIVEVLVPSNYYSLEEVKNLKAYLTSFD